MTHYETVFSFSTHVVSFEQVFLLLIGFGVAVFGFLTYDSSIEPRFRTEKNWKAIFFVIWGVAWVFGHTAWIVSDYLELKAIEEAIESGRIEVVQGRVAVLQTQRPDHKGPGDILRINDQEFEVRGSRSTRAYKHIVVEGGLLQEGRLVRIHHYNGDILIIDVPVENQDHDGEL
jgi:hypothetical protein